MERDFSTDVTLSYRRSHQTTKNTSFQDELKAVVNKRAVRNRVELNFNDEDDDEGLHELMKTRRRKMNIFKSSRTKTSNCNFQLSDDDEEKIRPKKVSFLKNQRNSDTLRSDTLRSDTPRSDTLRSHGSLISQPVRTSEVLSGDRCRQDSDSSSHSSSPALQNSRSESPAVKTSLSESSSCRRSQLESPVAVYSENSQWESSSERVSVATPPTPAPRQRAAHSISRAGDERDGQTHTAASRAAASEIHTLSTTSNTTTSNTTTTTTSLFSQTTTNPGSEAPQLGSEVSPLTDSSVLRCCGSGSSRTSRRATSHGAESRYLGTLKVLEQKETGLSTADSLRASVYQDWLKRKQEKLQATLNAKKLEDKVKEEKKLEEETSKKAGAETSFEAWKKNKQEVLKEKIREKQEGIKKLQEEINHKEEKKDTAKRIFEKWKQEHDLVLRKQHQKQLQTENRLKEKKEEEKERRTRESSLSVTQWNVRKKKLMEEKLESLRRKKEIKEMEEKYEKDERERMAVEVYEDWMRRKEFQQKTERRQKNMKVTMLEEPPLPWSPPNRTVPFRK